MHKMYTVHIEPYTRFLKMTDCQNTNHIVLQEVPVVLYRTVAQAKYFIH